MRQLRPVDIIVDLDVPESGFFADETMDGPGWGTVAMSHTFFGRDGWRWVHKHIDAGHLYLDGEPLPIPRRVSNDTRFWKLADVERFAHSLAQNGYLGIDQLYRVLITVRTIAETWGYLPPHPIPTRIDDHDPTRKDIYAVSEIDDTRDDLDGSRGAQERSFSLGDVGYRIDLSDEHWNDLLAAMAPYVKVARRDSGRADDPAARADRAKVRAWALRHGHPVGKRGRIPRATMDAYLTRRS
jgi:hypothetical protein